MALGPVVQSISTQLSFEQQAFRLHHSSNYILLSFIIFIHLAIHDFNGSHRLDVKKGLLSVDKWTSLVSSLWDYGLWAMGAITITIYMNGKVYAIED